MCQPLVIRAHIRLEYGRTAGGRIIQNTVHPGGEHVPVIQTYDRRHVKAVRHTIILDRNEIVFVIYMRQRRTVISPDPQVAVGIQHRIPYHIVRYRTGIAQLVSVCCYGAVN